MKNIGLYPRIQADTCGTSVVSLAGGVALVETSPRSGPESGVVDGAGQVAQADRAA